MGEEVEDNFLYCFRQLTEVAMKALSQGINDPGTAIQSLRALAKLLAFRLHHFPPTEIKNKEGKIKIVLRQLTFEETFKKNILPIWDYGKNDRLVQHEMLNLLTNILSHTYFFSVDKLLQKVKKAIEEKD